MQSQNLSRANTGGCIVYSFFPLSFFLSFPRSSVAPPFGDMDSAAFGVPRRVGDTDSHASVWPLELGIRTPTLLVVVAAVVVAVAPAPMPPPVLVHCLVLVPHPAMTICHRNPCQMGRQPAGSQGHKHPSQRSVLIPRVPARGDATSGRMIPMLEAPRLPSLLDGNDDTLSCSATP